MDELVAPLRTSVTLSQVILVILFCASTTMILASLEGYSRPRGGARSDHFNFGCTTLYPSSKAFPVFVSFAAAISQRVLTQNSFNDYTTVWKGFDNLSFLLTFEPLVSFATGSIQRGPGSCSGSWCL